MLRKDGINYYITKVVAFLRYILNDFTRSGIRKIRPWSHGPTLLGSLVLWLTRHLNRVKEVRADGDFANDLYGGRHRVRPGSKWPKCMSAKLGAMAAHVWNIRGVRGRGDRSTVASSGAPHVKPANDLIPALLYVYRIYEGRNHWSVPIT